MSTKLNRREWAAALAVSAAAAAQPDTPPQTPAAELEAARKRQRGMLERVRKFELPASIEPAFRFEA